MSVGFEAEAELEGLMAYVDASPTPFHAVASAALMLAARGFVPVDLAQPFPRAPGCYYVVRAGSLVAWEQRDGMAAAAPFRVLAGHTDSPNLRLKPRSGQVKSGWQMLAVEPYGGLLRNSWLDRDLGLAGRVMVRTPAGMESRLFHDNRPLLRVAQLAIHLDRGVNDGLVLNLQTQLTPIWGIGDRTPDVAAYLGERVGAEAADVLGADVMLQDTQPSARLGAHRELLAAPRLDNQVTCFAGVRALSAVAGRRETVYRPMLVLFDHEEVGSQSERGAQSTLLPATVERVVTAAGGDRSDLYAALAGTVVASGDMAHATHPNYPERHEPNHPVAVNGGPVLKVHAELRYATDGLGAAHFRLSCEQAGVPMQVYAHRSDLPCGSTIGPMTAARLGVTTVDVGVSMLSMHSARELCGAADPARYAAALAAFLAPA